VNGFANASSGPRPEKATAGATGGRKSETVAGTVIAAAIDGAGAVARSGAGGAGAAIRAMASAFGAPLEAPCPVTTAGVMLGDDDFGSRHLPRTLAAADTPITVEGPRTF
jgi:hypothetical protein